MNNITREAATTFEQVRALLEKQYAPDDIFYVSLGVAASIGPTMWDYPLDDLHEILGGNR